MGIKGLPFALMKIFLEKSNIKLSATQDELYEFIIDTISKSLL
jgi:hypothetical protein